MKMATSFFHFESLWWRGLEPALPALPKRPPARRAGSEGGSRIEGGRAKSLMKNLSLRAKCGVFRKNSSMFRVK